LEIVLYEVRPMGMFDETATGHIRALLERGMMSAGVFEADDCQKTYEELKAKGIEFISTPQKQPYGVEALFKDGCGNWFSLTQH
jgi:hypothetical protein